MSELESRSILCSHSALCVVSACFSGEIQNAVSRVDRFYQSPKGLVIRHHMYTIKLLHFSMDRKYFVRLIHVQFYVYTSSLLICAFCCLTVFYVLVNSDSEDSLGIIFYFIFFYFYSGPDFLQWRKETKMKDLV